MVRPYPGPVQQSHVGIQPGFLGATLGLAADFASASKALREPLKNGQRSPFQVFLPPACLHLKLSLSLSPSPPRAYAALTETSPGGGLAGVRLGAAVADLTLRGCFGFGTVGSMARCSFTSSALQLCLHHHSW